MKKAAIFLIMVMILPMVNLAQTTIYNIQGQTDLSPLKGQSINTKGIVTASFSTGYFIQDGDSAWCGIYVYDNTNAPAIGDSISITADVDEYYDLTELKNITNFSILSSQNTLPEAITLKTGKIDESYEGMLVKIENAICTNSDLGYGEWELDDGTGACVVDDLGYVFKPTLNVKYSVTGPLYFSYSVYKILPRDENDIEIAIPVYIAGQISQNEISKNSFKISWETNTEATTEIKYGLSPELELGELKTETLSTNHEIELSGLQAGMIYYAKAFSVAGNDTTPSPIGVYATESESSGKINVYFNHSVDNSVSSGIDAVTTDFITDTIISYIEKAKESLDIIIYDVESEEIIEAINQASSRGVKIRYITDDQPENAVLNNLSADIPLLRGNTEAIMHDKFIIVDNKSIDNSWVITGSINHTHANLGWDYNNMVCVQDQSLAKAYLLEFNEMWGAANLEANAENAKFGSQKTNNTPHNFIIGGVPVELYFSPSDNTTQAIAKQIEAAQHEMEFAVMVFTENSLGTAVKDAHDRNVEIRGIIDYVEYSGSEFDYLVDNGVEVIDYFNEDGTTWPDGPVMHHKYAIIDFNHPDADPVVITGSHNWSASAESKNDENTLIIHSATIANIFHQEFTKRFDQLVVNIEPEIIKSKINVYPNPASQFIEIVIPKVNSDIEITLYNLEGKSLIKKCFKPNCGQKTRLPIGYLNQGMYILQLSTETISYSKNILIVR